jgi:hypothetical protein
LRRALTEELELAGPDLDEAIRASHGRLPDRRAGEARDRGSGGTADGRGGHSVANNSPARRFRFGRWPQKWWSATGLLLVRFPVGNVAGTRSREG